MPTLLLEDVPLDVYQRLRQLAVANNEPIAVAAIAQLRKCLSQDRNGLAGDPRLPHVSRTQEVDEIPSHVPDPPSLTEEVSAPYDLPRPDENVRVEVQDVPMWPPDPPIFLQEPL